MNPIWHPTPQAIAHSNMTAFIKAVNGRYDLNLTSYEELHQWSIHHIQDFYRLFWDFCGLVTSHKGLQEIHLTADLFKTRFFEDTKLNYAENLLKKRPAEK